MLAFFAMSVLSVGYQYDKLLLFFLYAFMGRSLQILSYKWDFPVLYPMAS